MTATAMTDSTIANALQMGAALYVRPDAGLLRLTDADRADFLHRMTTNEINRLPIGKATVTVLTSATARILQVFTVLARPEELWLLPAAGATTALERHLRGQIFFMDKVQVANLSADYRRLRIVGPEAASQLSAVGLAVADLDDGDWMTATAGDTADAITVTVLRQLAYDIPGYETIVPAADLDRLLSLLQAAGIVAVDTADYEVRRVELGRPAPGHELTDEYNPLEAGIGWSCADNKGCYTGQEIIARQITYDKITKTLVGLQSESALAVGTELGADGRAVGTVTSSVFSSQLGAPLALAIVRRPYHDAGTQLEANGVTATVSALPFVSE